MGEGRMTRTRQARCERGPHQENFTASTGQVKCSCVSVSVATGPLSLLLKQDVVGKGKGAVTAPFFQLGCIRFLHMCAQCKSNRWGKSRELRESLCTGGVEEVVCAKQQFCFPYYSVGTLS